MRVRGPMLATIAAVGLSYAAAPYITLYRVGNAIRAGDARALETLVDWPSVREGIKEDVCDLVIDTPATATVRQAGAELPPFGASFMRGIASNAIDQAVTPQALLSAAGDRARHATAQRRGADVHVQWAFFESPGSFLVNLHAAGQMEPIRIEMTLRRGAWRIDRVWLPADLLSGQGSRT